ncbi:MAG: DNA-3-methyladenine glycosylase I [Candidatus Aminicenantaceae bacterium]
MKKRCEWVPDGSYCTDYHDREWGVPVHDDGLLFEHLILDAFQAGLSWEIVLRKRENFRMAFDGFDAKKIAAYNSDKIESLLQDAGIIRNRQKIEAAIKSARAFLKVQEEYGSFNTYIWGFVGGKSIQNSWKNLRDLPAKTPESEAMSRDLKKRGFSFVGPTICYAFMQAAGLVNDHTSDCYRYTELSGE